MGFIELEKSSGLTRLPVDATYRVSKKGSGVLRFTKNGVEKLTKLKGFDASKPVKIYVDRESKSLAFKQSEEGKFKLGGLAKGKGSLSYAAVNKELTENAHYMIEESKEYSFVLSVAKQATEVKDAKVEVEVEVEQAESTTKKGKGKKK